MTADNPSSPEQALALLVNLKAPEHLVRHHALVVEAAGLLVDGLAPILGPARVPRRAVLVGAALHDAGKIRHTEEMHGPGSQHEAAGESLLVSAGIPQEIARFCRTHASWSSPDCGLEDRLVALADCLWKGKRNEALESAVHADCAAILGVDVWKVYTDLEDLFEKIAAGGAERLERSRGAG